MVQEMRSEIDKLERENRALRGELSQLGSRSVTTQDDKINDDNYNCPVKEETLSKGVLRRNSSVGSAPISQQQKGVAMTVRRYSMSSSLLSSCFHWQNQNIKRHSSSGTLKLNGSVQDIETDPGNHGVTPGRTSEQVLINKIPKTKSFQECMHHCRGRVKAVTFLLPVDMREYTENHMAFQSPQNQSANHLSTIIEKDP
ncbi:putative coiled-coil domain-containing protein 195 [Pelobates fuscus]|uniref:putative coiled-coil domain-containing protein 195 n=1 Tax=Pelobates fuscus TaxID=191477 RepID=UPI002FE4E00F